MRIPEKEKNKILDYATENVVAIIGEYLQLKKTGANYSACCPFHGEKTASFSVSPERGTWHCFGSCGEGGGAVKFVMKFEGISFPDALRKIAAQACIHIPGAGESREERERKAILSALAKAEEFFQKELAANTNGGKAYVESRMTPEMVKAFGIGFAPKNGGKILFNALKSLGIPQEIAEKAGLIRKDGETGEYRDVFWGGRVMFPIKNKAGHTIGFAGRRIDGESKFKYVNSPETAVYKKYQALYGLHMADLSTGEVFVVEGYLDLMQMWAKGIHNVVAACGTALTADHIKILKKLGIRRLNFMFDSDAAGIKAAQRSIPLGCSEEIGTFVYPLPAGHDPDSFFKAGGTLAKVEQMTGLDFLEKIGVELTGTLRELHRLERLERAMLYFASTYPQVAAILRRRGDLEQLFSQDGISQLKELL